MMARNMIAPILTRALATTMSVARAIPMMISFRGELFLNHRNSILICLTNYTDDDDEGIH